MARWGRLLAIFSAVLLLTAALASAAGTAGEKKSYLVGFKPGASAKGLSVAGVSVVSEWSHLGAAHVMATAAGIQGLQRNPNVEYVEEDRPVYAFGHSAPHSDGTYTWGLQAVHAPEAWALGADGTGRVVCVLDTGIDYAHPAFVRGGVSIIKKSANFVSDGKPNAQDGNGHGTHVAGTVAGQGNGSGSYIGVAKGADLYVARVLGDNGSGSTSGVINGVNWCVNEGANILSLSLGSSVGSRTEQRAYDDAYNKGRLIIAASGNDGSSTRISYPAKYSSVVAVGAVDSNLVRASFSNAGKELELAGPGVRTLSSVPMGTGLAGTAEEAGTSYKNNPLEYAPHGSVSGPYVECGLADSTTSCPGKPASGAWIAMINRGSISFADKVKNVMAQGASAAVIANNDTANPDDAGSFTLGAAGTWIPTVSVSYNSGVAIRAGGLGSGTVAIGPWDYAYFQGTSMATPHASGVAAVAWSAKPTLSHATIRDVLQKSAKDLGATGRDNLYGFGLVQADAAVNAAKAR